MLKLQKKRKAKEKKVWKDQEDRWDHDRYSDDEQAPKSHDELVAAYGYDIRNNEGPPRAGQVNENKTPSEPTNPAWKKESKHNTQNEGPSRSGGGGGDADKSINHKSSPRDTRDKRQVQESVTLAASRARGRGFKGTVDTDNAGSLGLVFKSKGRGSVLPDNRRNNTGDLINKLKRMPVNDGGSFQQENSYPQSPGQVRPGTVPPRMQQQQQQQSPPQQSPRQQQPQQQQQQHDPAGNRPERYSSLRQRPPVPEGPGQQGYQPPHGQHRYFFFFLSLNS